jgi:hypothetical protein
MNLFIKIASIIYQTYDDRGVNIPYFRTIMTIVLLLFLHAVQIGLLFDLPSDYIMPWSSKSNKPLQWLYGSVYFGVLLTLILVIFRKDKLQRVDVNERQIKKCKLILPIYFTLCIFLLFFLLIKSGIEKGKINF